MPSRFATVSVLFSAFLQLAIDSVAAKTWQVFDEVCDETKYYPECSSLETVASKARENDSMQINISISQLTLASTLNFTRLKSLTIKGVLADTTTINCTDISTGTSTGITLSDIAGTIVLSNLMFISCGSHVARHNYASALTILRCKDVRLHRVVITRSQGIRLVILDHQGGSVNISFSKFTYNNPKANYSDERGGGILLKLDRDQQSQSSDLREPVMFKFNDCIFANNTAYGPPDGNPHYCSHYYTIAMSNRKGFEHGGGAYVSIGGSHSNVSVSFSRCEFSGNRACIGGGLMAEIHGEEKKTINQTLIEIENSTFYGNGYHIVLKNLPTNGLSGFRTADTSD